MTSQAIEGACAFAWRNYLLLHSGISENDNRRSALYRYVTNLRYAGEYDFDLLQMDLDANQVQQHQICQVVILGRECNERTRNPFLLDSARSDGRSGAQLRIIVRCWRIAPE
jgi:hypothetical protein